MKRTLNLLVLAVIALLLAAPATMAATPMHSSKGAYSAMADSSKMKSKRHHKRMRKSSKKTSGEKQSQKPTEPEKK